MGRNYTHIKKIEVEIHKMRATGKTRQEIADHFGLNMVQVKNLINRHNRTQKRIEAGIMPSRRGRRPKEYVQAEQDKDNIIKRLKMENELLRDFLRGAGRR
jgi:arsenate reductase-like glutaredoxin family protein